MPNKTLRNRQYRNSGQKLKYRERRKQNVKKNNSKAMHKWALTIHLQNNPSAGSGVISYIVTSTELGAHMPVCPITNILNDLHLPEYMAAVCINMLSVCPCSAGAL